MRSTCGFSLAERLKEKKMRAKLIKQQFSFRNVIKCTVIIRGSEENPRGAPLPHRGETANCASRIAENRPRGIREDIHASNLIERYLRSRGSQEFARNDKIARLRRVERPRVHLARVGELIEVLGRNQ